MGSERLCGSESSKNNSNFDNPLLNIIKKTAMHTAQGWIYGRTKESTSTEPPQRKKFCRIYWTV
jgi:hypothetical protein